MKTLTVLAAAVIALGFCRAASAANFSSWVASNGFDSNPCTRAAPCQSFQQAHDQTTPGGRIGAVDHGDYGPLTITKSISIVSDRVSDIVTPAGGLPANAISISAGPNDVVVLQGLDVDGAQNGSLGIVFNTGAKLIIQNCAIKNWFSGSGNGGLVFAPGGTSYLVVTDSFISNNTNGSAGSGILVRPMGSGSARVSLDRVVAAGNGYGVALDGSTSTAGINATITDSVLTSNRFDGLIATTSPGGAPTGALVSNSALTNNTFGIRSAGSNVTVRVEASRIIGNSTGLSAPSGGALLSAGNNIVQANGVNGAFTGSMPLQ